MQLFLKRLRKNYPAPVRFFGVGEYGEKFDRPHFHLALFGVSFLDHSFVDKAWGQGFVHVGELTHDSAQYIAGYVLKKMTNKDDPRLEGRYPEFARMSNRPGIGAGVCREFGEVMTSTRGYSTALARDMDVPKEMQVERKKYPLGRYLRKNMRQAVGWSGETPQVVRDLQVLEFQSLTEQERKEREANRIGSLNSAIARSKISASKKRL